MATAYDSRMMLNTASATEKLYIQFPSSAGKKLQLERLLNKLCGALYGGPGLVGGRGGGGKRVHKPGKALSHAFQNSVCLGSILTSARLDIILTAPLQHVIHAEQHIHLRSLTLGIPVAQALFSLS